ncbi:tRNA(Met) cytidine acetyltransferase TmcA [Halobacteriales archaeon Cl-PHB]
MRAVTLAARLRDEARRANERRLIVLTGNPSATREAAAVALQEAEVSITDTVFVGSGGDDRAWTRVDPRRTETLLGTTQGTVVLDCHDACRPNAIGRAAGAVDGGGLLVLLTPPLDDWPTVRDGFDDSLAVPPFDTGDVGGTFRRRLVATLRAHPGIAILDVGDGPLEEAVVEREGLTDPPPRRAPDPIAAPADHDFPAAAYDACLTSDQASAVAAFEAFGEEPRAVVLEADRGRGKSSAAGLAAACLAARGADVLVTAPAFRSASEVFDRAGELLATLDAIQEAEAVDERRRMTTAAGGAVRFVDPATAVDLPDDPDVLVVDEAAALPVRRLQAFLAAESVAFATTIHGYEGAGRGFSVRFRDHLDASDHVVRDVSLAEPIRYAPGDPVEVWAFRALCLDARPPVESLVADATPASVTYATLSPEDLAGDEHLLREAFGLLVLAHYRTEPDDLARLLDAPNISVRALCQDGHVVSVALLAQEGNLPAARRAGMYEGQRVRGNMIPDVLTSQLRDEAAGDPVGQRVLRIATHHAVRSGGLGSHLLDAIREEVRDEVDWLGVGYGATPQLLRFWRANGYATVHLSTTRNDASGEHSAVMLQPLSADGSALVDRHTSWFLRRLPSMLSDPLDDVDPDVVRETLRSVDGTPTLDLSPDEWRVLAGAPTGAAIFDTAPRPFGRIALRHLVDPVDSEALSTRQERLLVLKALQGRPWAEVADRLNFHSHAECMRSFGRAVGPLVDLYGDETARHERSRFA